MGPAKLLWKPAIKLAVGAAVFAGQVLGTAHRPDVPYLANQDPSGTFGDPSLPDLHFVLLGDSSVTAPGVDPIDLSWPRRMAHGLSDRHHVTLTNVAAGGAKAHDVLHNQVQSACEVPADFALVSVGANDALRGVPLRKFESTMHQIVETLLGSFDGVGMSGLGDLSNMRRLPTLGRGIAHVRSRSFDLAIRRVAQEHPMAVKATARHGPWERFRTDDPNVMFSDDQFHASGEGHALFGAGAILVVEELLRRRHRRTIN